MGVYYRLVGDSIGVLEIIIGRCCCFVIDFIIINLLKNFIIFLMGNCVREIK